MNAYFIRNRNQSLQWLWACLAAGELLICTGASMRGESAESFWTVVMPTMPVLAVAALIFYVFACANYVRAKCRDSAFPSALRSLIFSIFATGLYLFLVGAFDCTWTAYFGIPAVFALSAIPFKLMQDRSVPDDAESLS